jgi:TonB family protein
MTARPRRWRTGVLWLTVASLALAGCGEGGLFGRIGAGREPVEVPALVTTELPFKYPPGLYIERVQDDVLLRLHIDSLGAVVPESTRVERGSSYALFDSAAVEGAARLRFRPARRGERRIAYTVLFPIKFRVPNGPPMPSDTAGTGSGEVMRDSTRDE